MCQVNLRVKMKAVNYRQNEKHHSKDGKTVCWKIYAGEYQVQTTDPKVANVISRWNDIEKVGRGENFFMRLYSTQNRPCYRSGEIASQDKKPKEGS